MTRKSSLAGFALLALASALPQPALPAAATHLVMPIVYGTHVPGLGASALKLAMLVQQSSGGTVALDVKEPGEGTQPQDILDAVSTGKVDAGFATASFWAAKLPAAALFAGFPFGPDANTYMAWFASGDGRKLYQQMYDQAGYKVHVMPCAFGGAETSGWFAKEVSTPEELKDLRIRMFGLGGRVMSKLGATTVVMPANSVAQAFDQHKIDAAELLTPAADKSLRLEEHAKLIYVPGWHQPETVLELLVNQARWDGLDPAQQQEIDTACRTLLAASAADSASLQRQALQEFASKGVKILTWPSAMLTAFRSGWRQVANEESDRDLFFAEVLSNLEKFRSSAPALPPPPVSPAPARAQK